jgi:hypothetical protein
MWNENENIDFNFKDFQPYGTSSPTTRITLGPLRRQIRLTDTFILLIGNDTDTKTEYAAGSRGRNREGLPTHRDEFNDRFGDWFCPSFFADKGAVFMPFSSRIGARA